MHKTILRTACWTIGIIAAVLFLGCGTILIVFMPDPKPTIMTFENRSSAPISASFDVKSSRKEIERTEKIAQGGSTMIVLDIRDKGAVYDIAVSRQGKADKETFRFHGGAGNAPMRLVITDINKLESRGYEEVLPAVVP